jgi:hypothetical protein
MDAVMHLARTARPVNVVVSYRRQHGKQQLIEFPELQEELSLSRRGALPQILQQS